jgi:hypothetical protein
LCIDHIDLGIDFLCRQRTIYKKEAKHKKAQ